MYVRVRVCVHVPTCHRATRRASRSGRSRSIDRSILLESRGAPAGDAGRFGATLRDASRRVVARGKSSRFFVCVVVANARRRVEPVVGTGAGRSTDGRRARVAAQPPEGGDTVCVCPRGGKLTNNESWIDDNHGDRVIDASRGVDVVGARAKRRARDVVATAGMRPRDAKRFVSSGRRERSRRDANVDVGDGAERRGPGPDRGRAGRAEELEEELEQVKPRHRRVEERERDERRG